jgi:DEAD/DEAH box helicase domain-containing protein
VLEALLHDKRDCALYIFPVKALARDQLRALTALIDALPAAADGQPLIETGIYDGDTPEAARVHIKKKARIVFTNPEMLHMGMLTQHRAWGRFLRRVRFVVVDEAHVYRGVFGSHVALALRRLRRVCAAVYNSAPQVCTASSSFSRVFLVLPQVPNESN